MNDRSRFRPLTRQELENLGYTVKPGSKFLDVNTGEILTRRQRENIRVSPLGFSSYSQYQRQNFSQSIIRREQDRLFSTFQHILSTSAPGTPIQDLQRPGNAKGRELRRLYDKAQRAYNRSESDPEAEDDFEQAYDDLLDFLGLENQGNYDWNEIWERYKRGQSAA